MVLLQVEFSRDFGGVSGILGHPGFPCSEIAQQVLAEDDSKFWGVLGKTPGVISGGFWGGRDLRGDSGGSPTFSVVRSLSGSRRRWLNTMVNTACERLLVSFMFVAATVLQGSLGGPSVPGGVWGAGDVPAALRARTWPCCRCP